MKRWRWLISSLPLLAFGCASPDGAARVAADTPDRASFAPVSPVLVRRCGSLDCHGSPYRNMRLYGYQGRRLSPSHLPDAPDTTQDEIAANYEAVVGVEPERMAEVTASKGAAAAQLTLVRKARGQEAHKGGARIALGDAADLCLLGWLSGTPAEASCAEALKVP